MMIFPNPAVSQFTLNKDSDEDSDYENRGYRLSGRLKRGERRKFACPNLHVNSKRSYFYQLPERIIWKILKAQAFWMENPKPEKSWQSVNQRCELNGLVHTKIRGEMSG